MGAELTTGTDDFGAHYIVLGYGDAGIACAGININETAELVIFPMNRVSVIGTEHEFVKGKGAHEVGAVLRILFVNAESIDVMIDKLTELKNNGNFVHLNAPQAIFQV